MDGILLNSLADIAPVTSPVIALSLCSRLPLEQAAILDDHLLLPTEVDIKFPVIPPCDKYSTPNLSALLGCMANAHRLHPFLLPARFLGERTHSARPEAKRTGPRTWLCWLALRYGEHRVCAV